MSIVAADVLDLLPHLTPQERAEVLKLAKMDEMLWRPNPGPQSDAYYSEAQIIGYGGAAGGGKTDLLCGTLLNQHRRGIIFRREGTQLQGVYDRLASILGGRDGFNSQDKIWRPPTLPHLQIEFGSTPNPEDVLKYQGRPHDFKAFDEATNFLEQQVRFLMGWTRSEVEGQRQRILLTFNPPTTAEGQWVIPFFGPWLDENHANPAAFGEIRWFGTIDGRDYEVEDNRPFVIDEATGLPFYDFDPRDFRGQEEMIVQPLSRTFIFARVTDNPHLMRTGYMATLQAMPEPLRSQMLLGDFKAGRQDDAMQVIPTAWVDAAMKRWEDKHAKGPMDSMGVDVARGGRDKTVISRRHGTWFDKLIRHAGSDTPDGPTTAALVIAARRDKAPAHVDVVGWGASAYDFLVTNDVQAVPVNGSNKTHELTTQGDLRFANYRALLYWRMREALDPTNPDPIYLPPDTTLKADLCAPRWELRTNGILVESKDDIRKRIGRSPDDGDAVVNALITTIKDNVQPDSDRRHTGHGSHGWMG